MPRSKHSAVSLADKLSASSPNKEQRPMPPPKPPSNPYTRRVCSADPATILFLIDRSGSMGEEIAGAPGISKARATADLINCQVQYLLDQCPPQTNPGLMKSYFKIGFIAYGDEGARSLFPKPLLTVNELNEMARIEDRLFPNPDGTTSVGKMRVWVDPVAKGGTPMCAALRRTIDVLRQSYHEHPDAYPGTVFNISDGNATDGSPEALMNELRSTGTTDGSTLLWNVQVSSVAGANTLAFCNESASFPDDAARMMCAQSSPLLPRMIDDLQKRGFVVPPHGRMFVCNGTIKHLAMCLDVGSPNRDLYL